MGKAKGQKPRKAGAGNVTTPANRPKGGRGGPICGPSGPITFNPDTGEWRPR